MRKRSRRNHTFRNQMIGVLAIFFVAALGVGAGITIALKNVEAFNACIAGEHHACLSLEW